MKNEQRKIYRGDKLLAVLFIACMAIFCISNLLTKDRKLSENENRTLTQRPTLTLESVMSGSYEEKLEEYLSDQMVFREQLKAGSILLKQLGGSKREKGVLCGKSGELFKEISRPDEQLIEKNINAINQLTESQLSNTLQENLQQENLQQKNLQQENLQQKESQQEALLQAEEKDIKVYFLLVPDKAEIYPDLLPDYATVESEKVYFEKIQAALSTQVQWLDGIDVMSKHKEQKIYYKTDHHWTSYGAFQMFREMAGQLGIEETQLVEYEAFPVTENFQGVLSRNSGFEAKVREEIEVYLPKEEVEVVVNYVDERKKRSSLFDTEKLETADKYAVFLGGNSSLIDIRTTAACNRTILIIKDSFANSFIPFLVPYYKEIVVVDPRYYAGTMGEVLKQYAVNDILFLYSGGTFLEDNHLAGFLENE